MTIGASTFAKGLQVLACFQTAPHSMTMAEVARRTGFDKATARRLCLTLVDCGYLRQTGRALELTARPLALGAGFLAGHDFGRRVQPVLDRAAPELDSEIALATLDGERAIYVARAATPSARISLGFTVGSTLPLLPTAMGRVLLAQLPPEEREGYLNDAEIRQFTSATEVDRSRLRASIEAAAQEGACHLENEFEMGAGALAVPCGLIGGVPAALGTTATVGMLQEPERRAQILDILRRAALGLGFDRPES